MSDESQLRVGPKDGDSSLSLSNVRSGLIARGRKDAADLPEPADSLAKIRRLAEEGDADAQLELGEAYHDGRGVPQDYLKALAWHRKAADQLHLYALRNLGEMLEKGEGVPVDQAEACRYYCLAADIALAALDGDCGNSKWDPDAIIDILCKGAERGHVKAQRVVVDWCRARAESGSEYGQFDLGDLYASGRWVPQAYVQAHMWFNLAATASTGDDQKKYSSAREAVAAKMTHQQIDEAQRLAREWEAGPTHGQRRGSLRTMLDE